jgi:hypothetical protein
MEPPSIERLETKENFLANMKYHNDPEIATEIIQRSIANEYLDEAFALQLIDANYDCYKVDAGEEWERFRQQRNVALLAVQKDVSNLDYVPDELKEDEIEYKKFLADALSNHEHALNEHVPEWKKSPYLIRRIIPLNPELLFEIDPTLYTEGGVGRVNTAFPTWKTNLPFIKHFIRINPALFNEVDPSMYDNPKLIEFIRNERIPVTVLNKGTPEQERFKQRMSDLRGVALTQKNIFNLRSKENKRPIGLGSVTRVNEYLGDRKLGRGGKTKKKRKPKRNKN